MRRRLWRGLLLGTTSAAVLTGAGAGCGERVADAALCRTAAERIEVLEVARAVGQALETAPEERWPVLAAEMRSALLSDPAIQATIRAHRDAFMSRCEGRAIADVQCIIDAPGYNAYLGCLAQEAEAGDG